ncbi:MAG: hypothetical protein R3185_07670, partial [Candidatus Thermoplasmatota archaeon]|nr:hypothetical protein [Candidatus Thermoplasmatota archaeon]
GTFAIQDTGPDGQFLGFQFCNDGGSEAATLLTDGSSSLSPGEDQPPYPTPEWGTALITTLGLLLVGLVVRRDRR